MSGFLPLPPARVKTLCFQSSCDEVRPLGSAVPLNLAYDIHSPRLHTRCVHQSGEAWGHLRILPTNDSQGVKGWVFWRELLNRGAEGRADEQEMGFDPSSGKGLAAPCPWTSPSIYSWEHTQSLGDVVLSAPWLLVPSLMTHPHCLYLRAGWRRQRPGEWPSWARIEVRTGWWGQSMGDLRAPRVETDLGEGGGSY